MQYATALQPAFESNHVADPGFEQRLIEGIRPIAEHFLAQALHHLFTTGLYERLECGSAIPVEQLASEFGMDHDRLRGLLLYLANEGVVEVDGTLVKLTAKGSGYAEFRAWYTLMIGGYATTVAQIGDALPAGSAPCTRDGAHVGAGSCEISRYDGMAMTATLLSQAGVQFSELLDLGCGNALYLAEFCRAVPHTRAWGSEPDVNGYREARERIAEAGLAERVRLANRSAIDFLNNPPADCSPDLIVFGYVLHEILGQDGEQAVVMLLKRVAARFPDINIVVIEVANEIQNPTAMQHGLAINFWNPYYLIHYFTRQHLETRAYWEKLFAEAGLSIVGFTTTDPHVDSTGLELGYLLRGPDHRSPGHAMAGVGQEEG
jgi:2-ketoarginine methyltransferase